MKKVALLICLFVLSFHFSSCQEKGFTSQGFKKTISASILKEFDSALQNPTRISSLNLSEKGLDSIPVELDKRFTNLIQLSLRDNKIKEIPETMGTIKSLKSLHIDKNQLITLPASLANLNKLGTLVAASNKIATLPDVAFQFAPLATVDLRWNKITELPANFSNSNITALWLIKNPLKRLPDNFGNMQSLRVLWIRDTEIKELPDSFYKLQQLRELDLRGTFFTENQVIEIKRKLPNCKVISDF